MRLTRIIAIALIIAGAIGLWLSTRIDQPHDIPDTVGTFPGASVVMVTLDTTRADRLGCYGSTAGLTPFIDSLAQHGIVFENAQSVAPVTLPAHSTMMTGLNPIKHEVRNNGMFRAGRGQRGPWPRFSQRTATQRAPSFPPRSWSAGTASVKDLMSMTTTSARRARAGRLWCRRAAGMSRSKPPKNGWQPSPMTSLFSCGFTSMTLTHPMTHRGTSVPVFRRTLTPARLPSPTPLVADLVNTLDQSGRLDNTVFTVLADHGEALGEHGEDTHGFLLHQATIHVPWILTTPAIDQPYRVVDPVSITDLSPLLTTLVELRTPNGDNSDGQVPIGTQHAAGERRALYFETMLPNVPVRLVRTARVCARETGSSTPGRAKNSSTWRPTPGN